MRTRVSPMPWRATATEPLIPSYDFGSSASANCSVLVALAALAAAAGAGARVAAGGAAGAEVGAAAPPDAGTLGAHACSRLVPTTAPIRAPPRVTSERRLS